MVERPREKLRKTGIFASLGVVEHQLPRATAGGFDYYEYSLSATASENDDRNTQQSITTAMSDVDAVSSLPAALRAGQNATAVTVNPRSASGSLSSKRVSPSPHRRGDNARVKEVDSASGEGDGPPSPKADSEAETIIQSGRESLSPEKRRKYIQHEPRRLDVQVDNSDTVGNSALPDDTHIRKRNRSIDESIAERDRGFSPELHSRTAISPSHVKIEKAEELQPALMIFIPLCLHIARRLSPVGRTSTAHESVAIAMVSTVRGTGLNLAATQPPPATKSEGISTASVYLHQSRSIAQSRLFGRLTSEQLPVRSLGAVTCKKKEDYYSTHHWISTAKL